jgi:hypothetical protein
MHHIMHNDPCQRYIHRLKCEDTKVRLWFKNRCDVIVPEESDLNKASSTRLGWPISELKYKYLGLEVSCTYSPIDSVG